jgi:hypothetical protein
MLKRPLLWLIVAAMLSLQGACIASRWSAVKAGTPDFAALYGTAKFVHRGVAPNYDPTKIHGVDASVNDRGAKPLPPAESQVDMLHPPFEILLFLPFTWMPYAKAYIVWSASNLVFLWGVVLVLWKYLPRLHPEFEVLAILYGSFLPVIICLIQGQDSILLLLLLSLSFAALAEGRDRRAGIFLALGLFKFHLVLPLIVALMVMRRWRVVAGFFLGFGSLLLVSFAVVGTRATLKYIPFISHFSRHISVHASERTAMMPNVRGLVAFLSGSFASAREQSLIVICLSAVILLLTIGWIWKFRKRPAAVWFSLVLAVTSLISYHYYIYNSVILVLPLLLVTNELAAPGCDRLLRRVFTAVAISVCATLMAASVGLIVLEVAMPLLAVETLLMAAALFAIPYRMESRVSHASQPSAVTAL